MKMSYGDLAGKPRTLQSLTDVNPQEFSDLLKSFELAWQESIASRVNNPNGQRAYGAGHTSELALIAAQFSYV